MAKSKIIPLILFLLICNYLYSQNKIPVTGRIIDSVKETPVDYCTIALIDQQTGKVINGTISDIKGRFTIPVEKPGIYKLKAEFIGYISATKENITIAKSHVDLGDFLLQPSTTTLQTITITGAKPMVENKIDKLVYNTANDLTAQGGVALDVLKKVPMVSVDIDGNVELQGNGNIRFLINGKPSSIFGPSLVDALQSIPASQIKSIEVDH